jgi:small-conductance mechanosensitive channel
VQHHIVGYLLLQSFSWVTLIVLIAAVGVTLARMAVRRMVTEARERRTMETIVTLAVEVAALLAVGLVVFGTPQQMPTILGFATAAVTVVFQDFILAFFGWFSLMGKHGIRVGDWVEINSVAGEVAEISLFRTVLLETGNWTTKGHPTGRRMSFSNSFALKGQFFNFSTNGQWMWDELSVNVPATANAYELIKQVQAAVDEQTASDTAQAELEWQRVAKDIGVGQFGAKPTVELRPAATGVDVVVRFVTRASERFALRAKVNEVLVGLMGGAEKTGETTTTATAS